MRIVFYTLGLFLVFAGSFSIVKLGFENPDITPTRFLITFWQNILSGFFICLIGSIWIIYADRWQKQEIDKILINASKNDDAPTWRSMQALRNEVEEDNKTGELNIYAKPEDVSKCISDLTDQISNLKQDIIFLSNEIMKMDYLQDDEKIMRLYRKYNE